MRSPRRLPPDTLQPYLLDVPHPRQPPGTPAPEPAGPTSWRDLFGNDRPVEIEVGFGKGLFLTTQGAARPDINFLGIEIERKYVLFTAERLAKRNLRNVRLVCTDARWYFRARVADGSVAAVHVYFPDPWWKKRHHKRRVLTPEFLAEIARVLPPAGLFHFVSDVQAYFDETLALVASHGLLVPLPVPERGPDDYLTNFERKYRQEGRPIYRALFERRDA